MAKQYKTTGKLGNKQSLKEIRHKAKFEGMLETRKEMLEMDKEYLKEAKKGDPHLIVKTWTDAVKMDKEEIKEVKDYIKGKTKTKPKYRIGTEENLQPMLEKEF